MRNVHDDAASWIGRRFQAVVRWVMPFSYEIVQWFPPDAGHREWRRVRLPDGRAGYVASRFLRSPVDYRAFFELKDGRWWLVAFVAGD